MQSELKTQNAQAVCGEQAKQHSLQTEETQMFFRNRPETPVGRIQVAGCVKDTWRLCTWPMRVLGTYAIVYVTEGAGRFRDALGSDLEVLPGDLLVLFPDVPHSYGPRPGGHWSEIYAHFDGPPFTLWQQAGLLDPTKPVHRLLPLEQWRAELQAVLRDQPVENETGQIVQVSQFLAVLTRMLATGLLVYNEGDPPQWLQIALALLDTDFSNEVPLKEIAKQAGLPYHTFRKRFEHATGLPPTRYRFTRRMEAASSMLLHTKMKVRDIAESLHFNDEFHFSNRFQWYTGLRPSAYRREGRMGTLPFPAGSSLSWPPRAGRDGLNGEDDADEADARADESSYVAQ